MRYKCPNCSKPLDGQTVGDCFNCQEGKEEIIRLIRSHTANVGVANHLIDLLSDLGVKAGKEAQKAQKELLYKAAQQDTAQQCYLEALAVECGEGEVARAIRTKFNLKGLK